MLQPPLVISQMFAFVATAEMGEGVAAMLVGDTFMPLIGADQARVDSLRQMAQVVADRSGQPLTLLRFSVREELETLYPATTGRP